MSCAQGEQTDRRGSCKSKGRGIAMNDWHPTRTSEVMQSWSRSPLQLTEPHQDILVRSLGQIMLYENYVGIESR